MSFTHKHSRAFTRTGETPLTYDKSVTAESEVNVSPVSTIPDGAVDMEFFVSIDRSQLKSLFIASDQALTIETNHPGGTSGAPDDTISLPANQPIDWAEGDAMTCPITADVTALYITNASGSAATFELRALVDPTP